MTKLIDIIASQKEVVNIVSDNRDGKKVSVFGVQKLFRAAVTSLVGSSLVVCSDFFTAGRFARAAQCFTDGVTVLKEREEVLLPSGSTSVSARERFTAMGDICTGKAKVVVTTAQALMQLYPPRDKFRESIVTLKVGDEIDPMSLSNRLSQIGYKKEEQLTDACRYARRGDIFDVYPVNSPCPYRIEFFGDEIEKISEIDAETQLSVKQVDQIVVYPFSDIFGQVPQASEFAKQLCPNLSAEYRARGEEMLSTVSSEVESGVRKSYLLPYVEHCTLTEFCGARTFIVDECKRVYDAMDVYFSEHKQRYESLYVKGETLSGFFEQVLSPSEAARVEGAAITFHSFTSSNRFFDPEQLYVLRSIVAPRYVGNHKQLITDVENWQSNGYKVVVCCASEQLKKHICDLMAEDNVGWCDNYAAEVTVVAESADSGEIMHDMKLAIIGENDLVGRKSETPKTRRRNSFIGEPKIGEYVVHDVHGIGVCEGVRKVTVGKAVRDYVVVGYSAGDKLYVPVENMDSLTRYISGDKPRLSKMGGTEFAKQKVKARESIKKLAFDLKELYAQRFKADAYRYSNDDSLLHDFEGTFEYTETEDQMKAVSECIADLKSPKIMDRLLCGDVGYGKTEVALRVAFKVIAEGKQVAFLSPTTVLAKQHYDTVVKRMNAFGVKVGRLTRFDSPSSIKNTLLQLKEGKLDIVVGTHRLLSKDVEFCDLGLLVLDEEQRFGVGDKEKIKNIRREVNVLTLSATPIPRTLHMSMTGIRDMSLLETPPMSRLPVQTYVTEYSDALLRDAIMREMGRGGQTFVIFNHVERINEFAARVSKLVPEAGIVVAHGQMPEGALEKAVDAFVSGEGDVMISSTIIENGVDIPRANTLLVVDSDRMGLSQLYQLRGRVGRSDRAAYAFFTYAPGKVLSKEAYERLESIGKYTELGSGFKIAMRDLEIRGAGNILGAEQHGHMEKVGYDMYCSLLEEVLDEMDGKPIKKRKEVRMTVDYSAHLPDGYITDSEWKFKLYSRISRIGSLQARNTLLKELADLYGPVPDSVKNLVNIALIKNLAENVGASAVVMNKRESKVVFDYLIDLSSQVHAVAIGGGAKLVSDDHPALKFNNNNELLKFLLNCLNLLPKNV